MLNNAKFSISSRGPQLWNKILSDTKKHVSNPFIFKAQKKKQKKQKKTKTLFSTDNDLEIFYIQEFNKNDGAGSWSFDNEFAEKFVIFDVDNNSSVKPEYRKNVF